MKTDRPSAASDILAVVALAFATTVAIQGFLYLFVRTNDELFASLYRATGGWLPLALRVLACLIAGAVLAQLLRSRQSVAWSLLLAALVFLVARYSGVYVVAHYSGLHGPGMMATAKSLLLESVPPAFCIVGYVVMKRLTHGRTLAAEDQSSQAALR